MTTKTPREVIADAAHKWFADAYNPEVGRLDSPDVPILAALTAAGFVIVPREPTREMWAASGTAVVVTRERSENHDDMSEAVWSAMIAEAEKVSG